MTISPAKRPRASLRGSRALPAWITNSSSSAKTNTPPSPVLTPQARGISAERQVCDRTTPFRCFRGRPAQEQRLNDLVDGAHLWDYKQAGIGLPLGLALPNKP